jgi:PDZ domain-containing protein
MTHRSFIFLGALCGAMLCAPRANAQPILPASPSSNLSTPGSPVQIESCEAGEQSNNILVTQSNGNFHISFTNAGSVTANLVRFQIDYGSERLFVRDVGQFSPGITISHNYNHRGRNIISYPILGGVPLHCSVVAVHFVNGTQWAGAGDSGTEAGTGIGYVGVQLQQQDSGVFVQLVFPGSPAEKGGVIQGDGLNSINSNRITNLSEAVALLSASPPGTKLRLAVNRSGRAVKLTVVVGKRPASAASL